MADQKSPRFLIKKSIDAIQANLDRESKIPQFLVVDNQETTRQTCFFVWGVKAQQAETTEEHHTPFSMSMFTSDNIDVQLEKDGDFVSAAAALELGKVRFEGWKPAYHRAGFFNGENTREVAASNEGFSA